MKQNTTVDTKDLVTTIAYLIGVRKNVLEQCFMESSQDYCNPFMHPSQPRSFAISVNCVQRFSVRLRKPMMKCDTI